MSTEEVLKIADIRFSTRTEYKDRPMVAAGRKRMGNPTVVVLVVAVMGFTIWQQFPAVLVHVREVIVAILAWRR